MKAHDEDEAFDKVSLSDYVLSYGEGDKLQIDSVVMKLKYYEAYLKALEGLRSGDDQ